MPGILGQFFSQFGLGIAAAIVMSWLESLLFLTVRMAYGQNKEPITFKDLPAKFANIPALFKDSLKNVLSFGGFISLAFAGATIALMLKNTGLPTPALMILAILLAPVLLTAFKLLYAFLEALTDFLHKLTIAGVSRVAKAYAKSLNSALKRPWIVMVIVGLFMVSVVGAMKNIGFAFTPNSDSGLVNVDLTLPIGTNLATTNALTSKIEQALMTNEEVRLVETSVGAGAATGGNTPNAANLKATLIDKANRPGIDTLIAKYLKELQPIAKTVAGTDLSVKAQQGGPGGSSDISLALTAPNQAALIKVNRAVVRLLNTDSNFRSVDSSLSATSQERTFIPDASKLSGTGLSTSDIANALRSYNDGSTSGTVRDGDRSIDIVVKLDPSLIKDEQSLLSQTVYSQALKANIPLSQLGHFEVSQAPATLSRLNKAYTATIDINMKEGGPNPFGYQKEIISKVTNAGLLTNGVTLGNASAFGSAGLTNDLVFYGPILMIAAIMLTYLVLGSQFNSFRYPIYLLLPIPIAIVGALWTLSLFGANLDVITVLGMVVLLGLSTKNSILYLEFVTERARILPLHDALIEAAELRFRPIIMTTLTVLVISIPLILGQGDGSEFRRGLGIVILGGVITSTLLTFYVVPSVFWQFEKKRVKPENTITTGPNGSGLAAGD